MNERAVPEDRGDDAAGEGPVKRSLRLKHVFTLVVPAALLFVAAVLFFGFFDGPALLARLTCPPLVPGKGQLIYQGKPLPNALLFTRPVRGHLKGATGFGDEEGRFELMTDIQGVYIKGAYAGEHLVTVVAYRGSPVPGRPAPLLSPKKYDSFATTPLKISVSRSPEENEFLLTLEGDSEEAPEPPSGGRPGGRGPDRGAGMSGEDGPGEGPPAQR